MKKIIVLFFVAILSLGTLAGCGGTSETSASASDKLVVYSPNSEDIINTIIPMFEKETGIKVELVTAGTGELFKRLQSEKNNPYADVLFGGSITQYSSNLDLFEKYVSPNDKYLIDGHKNTTGRMTPYIIDGNVLLVNTNLIGDIKIESYKDLLNPALKGKIASTDPASSSSAFGQLTNMLLSIGGDYTSEDGWNYVSEVIKNLDGKVLSGSGAVHKSVADGEYVVALTYEEPSVSYVKSGAPVKVVYPKEGVVFNDSGSGIVKGATNIENAKKFIDFILSKKAQNAFGSQLTSRPLRKDAQLGSYMQSLDNIHLINADYEYIQKHKSEIVEKYTETFTSLQQ